MGEGFDQLGKRNRKLKNLQNPENPKIDDSTHIISNIVYARDMKIFEKTSGLVNQRNAFNHQIILNIKQLIKSNQE